MPSTGIQYQRFSTESTMYSLLCFSSLFLLAVRAEDSVTLTSPVETSHGPVQGAIHTYDGTTVHVFKGIPFAAPPVGDLRFASPVAPEPWTEPLRCVEYRNRCVANPAMDPLFFFPPREPPPMSEDCLHLNIVAPQPTTEKRAVMLYIHGGGLMVGSSTDIEIEGLAIGADVIHVAINYRLGVFGFLASSDDSAPGNAGFLDQIAALRWVKENIASFGGDPDRITIFGISAGGWSVSAHMVSPLSKGLFSRAIAQSGSMYGIKMENREERNTRTQRLAEGVECPGSDAEMLTCLREKPAAELHDSAVANFYLPVSAPICGDDVLPQSVTELYDSYQTHPDVEYMTGMTSEEGGFWLMLGHNQTEDQIRMVKEGISMDSTVVTTALNTMVTGVFDLTPGRTPAAELTALFKNIYLKDYSNPISNLRGILDLASDCVFVGPTMGMAEKVIEGGQNKMYVYWVDQAPAKPVPTNFPQLHLHAAPELKYGALHGFDSFYMFGLANVKDVPMSWYDEVPLVDKKVAESMLNAWATFSKTGTPVYYADNGVNVEWPQYSLEKEEYLQFKYPMSSDSVKRRLKPGVNELYNKLIPAYMKTVLDNAIDAPQTENPKKDMKDEL